MTRKSGYTPRKTENEKNKIVLGKITLVFDKGFWRLPNYGKTKSMEEALKVATDLNSKCAKK